MFGHVSRHLCGADLLVSIVPLVDLMQLGYIAVLHPLLCLEKYIRTLFIKNLLNNKYLFILKSTHALTEVHTIACQKRPHMLCALLRTSSARRTQNRAILEEPTPVPASLSVHPSRLPTLPRAPPHMPIVRAHARACTGARVSAATCVVSSALRSSTVVALTSTSSCTACSEMQRPGGTFSRV